MNVPRILIVDDDTALLQALPEALALRMGPVEVDVCDSAHSAIERIAQTDYDAIVTDIKMPGMDGLALLERIRALRPHTPTLLITGHGDHDLTIQALRGGAYDFIQKPVDRDYIVASLGRAIQMRQLRRQVDEQQQALQRHADELEQLVWERTRALLEANETKDAMLQARDHALEQAQMAMREQQATHKQVDVLAQALAQQARELRAIIEAMPDGVCVCNAAGQITRVNARWVELVGMPAEEALLPIDRHGVTHAFRHDDGSPLSLEEYPLMQALRGITCTNLRLMLRQHNTGRDIHIRASSAPIRGENGAITGAVAVASDITEIYQLERHKDEFLSIASHELKTPLATLKILAQLIHRRLQRADSPVPPQLANMERAIGRMEVLVNDLVDISRIESGKLALRPERVSLTALCAQAVDEHAAVSDRVIVFDMPTDPFEVEVDTDRIGQVLANLLSNALKYSKAERPVTLALAQSGAEAVLRVHDEGPGIPLEELPHVFDRFYRVPGIDVQTGSGVGLGLGLYITHEIVERHGGRIWAESQPGAGSTFCVALPLAGAASGSAASSGTFRHDGHTASRPR
jgi:PAS domain S-box-containing protein